MIDCGVVGLAAGTGFRRPPRVMGRAPDAPGWTGRLLPSYVL
jgi:hypothetical protein